MSAEKPVVEPDSCGSAVENASSLWENYRQEVTPRRSERPGSWTNLSERSDMDILPPGTTPLAIPRPDDSAPVDGCPNCVRNVEEPRLTTRLIGAVRGHYDCSDCGHAWATDWAV